MQITDKINAYCSSVGNETPQHDWLFHYPTQLCITGKKIYWTDEAQLSLKEYEGGQGGITDWFTFPPARDNFNPPTTNSSDLSASGATFECHEMKKGSTPLISAFSLIVNGEETEPAPENSDVIILEQSSHDLANTGTISARTRGKRSMQLTPGITASMSLDGTFISLNGGDFLALLDFSDHFWVGRIKGKDHITSVGADRAKLSRFVHHFYSDSFAHGLGQHQPCLGLLADGHVSQSRHNRNGCTCLPINCWNSMPRNVWTFTLCSA